jgi:hypothetical protein
MKKLINKVLEAALILLSILFLGALVPFVIAFFVAIGTDYTIADCTVCCPPFWAASSIGTVLAGTYIDHILKTNY